MRVNSIMFVYAAIIFGCATVFLIYSLKHKKFLTGKINNPPKPVEYIKENGKRIIGSKIFTILLGLLSAVFFIVGFLFIYWAFK